MANNEFQSERSNSDGGTRKEKERCGQDNLPPVPVGERNFNDDFNPYRFLPPELFPRIPSRNGDVPGNGQRAGRQPGADKCLQPPTVAKQIEIPTLHLDKPADKNDRTNYPLDSQLAKVYIEAKDGVVQIFGEGTKVVNGKTVPYTGAGSGFFVSEDGKIATACHVVENKHFLTVKTTDGGFFSAKIEKLDPLSDVAVIKLDSGPEHRFKALPLANKPAAPGEVVIGLGHPEAWDKVFLSAGQVEEFCRTGTLSLPFLERTKLTSWSYISSKQNMRPGNSGGPLLSQDGKVIGVFNKFNDESGAQDSITTGVDRIHALLNDDHEGTIIGPTFAHTGLHAVNGYNRFKAWRSCKPGQYGSAFSIGLGAYDLVSEDFGSLGRAITKGSGSDILSSSIQVGADLLLLGGGLCGLRSRDRVVASLLPLGGSVVKLATDGLGYYRISQAVRAVYPK